MGLRRGGVACAPRSRRRGVLLVLVWPGVLAR
uniref:Uncharacterized protein n=1 Tax=Arundo donax TaxID=35708 RepID=A0A0A8ZC25_ARUDO